MLRSCLLAAALAVGAAPAAAGPIYLALGDSSAFGETDRTRNPSNGDRGYVAAFADHLGTRLGQRPTVVNLAIDGETTASFTSGTGRSSDDGHLHNTHYGPPYRTQRDTMRSELAAAAAAGNPIGTVTVQLGANDLFVVAEAAGFLDKTPAEQQAAVGQAIAALARNYAGILTELRAALPAAEMYLIGYHNPYGSSPEHPFYPLSDPAVQAVNQVVAGLAPNFGATYVDFYSVISGREKELTLIDDGTYNVHLNDAGYAVAAQELIRTSSAATPEPGTLTLFAVACVGAAGFRRLTRRAARPATVA